LAGRFAQLLQGIDGDEELFAEMAPGSAAELKRHSEQLLELAANADMDGLSAIAHKISGSWPNYAEAGDEKLASDLRVAAIAGNHDLTLETARRLGECMRRVAAELLEWQPLSERSAER
jgi:hypothetical protein